VSAPTAPAPVHAPDELDEAVEFPVGPPVAALVPLAGFLVLLGLAVGFDPSRTHVAWQASLAVFGAAVFDLAVMARPGVALLLAACAWFDYDGFVVGHQGTLHWHGGTDVVRLVVLVGSALVALTIRSAVRLRRGGATDL
jgi:K+-sensing histidine kinase KdpD